jgi:UDP-3-O-[3-hydroxymyristoyl] glucosamine N-acyltransferase
MAKATATEIKLGELAKRLGGELSGDPEMVIHGMGTLADASAEEISFLANSRYEKYMSLTKAAAVIVATSYAGPAGRLIRCQDPYFAFCQAMVLLYGQRGHPFSGIDPSARVDPTAKLGAGVAVGPFATVCANAQIGDKTVLYPGVFIGPNVRVGRDCILYPNVVVYENCLLGDRVILHACTVIGEDGFGYATHAGKHEKIPPVGWAEVHDDVEIGANCAIDRASMGPTVIGAGTKFSNLVAIGHGTKIGKHCLFVAQVGIAGSVTVGDYCAFAGQSGTAGHLNIGNQVRVGAQAGVHSDVPAGQEVLGSPAIPLAQARRVVMSMSQLPELRQELKRLTAEVAELKAKLGSAEDPAATGGAGG